MREEEGKREKYGNYLIYLMESIAMSMMGGILKINLVNVNAG